MEGLAGVLEADLPNYKSKILRILCTVYVCRRPGAGSGRCWFSPSAKGTVCFLETGAGLEADERTSEQLLGSNKNRTVLGDSLFPNKTLKGTKAIGC